ncbi:uncharacterized protein LOC127006538 [Eriocheir sinensis]|uniref:uncharacterized protein LOC127006538 n=1 Tax=Eriocheir sinensis TaxID=95602 RepID=UPI0021C610CD|nr:uncharacterized protein LOC127006538 [Eriocheir sinensis]
MHSQVAVLLVCLAGLSAGLPSRLGDQSSVPATALDPDQLRETVTVIEKFIPPLFQAINDDNGDATDRLNKVVESSLLLSREALKLRKPTASNQEILEEVEAARETMPLIMDIVRASINSFKRDSSFDGLFDIPDIKIKTQK